jgi:tRNA(fMet)-specific endonuclease VapC
MIDAYARLQRLVEMFTGVPLLAFDKVAADHYLRLRATHRKTGSMDLRIASIVLANDAVLVTRNARDFEGIDGLRIEDWSRP